MGWPAPDAVVADSGLLKHILPRFSLKTGVRIVQPDPAGGAGSGHNAPPGTPVFQGGDQYLLPAHRRHDPRQQRFLRLADFGDRQTRRSTAFQPGGNAPVFQRPDRAGGARSQVAPTFDGDAEIGAGPYCRKTHCGRCHVIGEANRMKGLGSTPSFAVLRCPGRLGRPVSAILCAAPAWHFYPDHRRHCPLRRASATTDRSAGNHAERSGGHPGLCRRHGTGRSGCAAGVAVKHGSVIASL